MIYFPDIALHWLWSTKHLERAGSRNLYIVQLWQFVSLQTGAETVLSAKSRCKLLHML